MKKLFTLLTLFLSFCSGAWATVIPTCDSDGNYTFTVNDVEFKMIPVEGGTFQMGATSTGNRQASPVHSVTLSSYFIAETEVTQELYKAVMNNANPSNYVGDKRPVERVSWSDAVAFITALNELTGQTFRLPTEAEWEFAAKGGNKTQNYLYAGSNTLSDVAWCWYNSNTADRYTRDVATKAPNELGLYDMNGNVWEWCSDWYGTLSDEPQTNPTGPATGTEHVVKGFSCYNTLYDSESSPSYGNPVAFHGHTANASLDLGFRIVMTSPQVFAYTVSGDEVTITGFASDFDVPENYDLVIPDEIEGKPVVAIYKGAFQYIPEYTNPRRKNINIKTVTVGKNVETIWNGAFRASAIESITLPEDSKLKRFLDVNGKLDNAYIFYNCSNLKRIVFPKSLQEIPSGLMMLSGVEEITFLGKVITMGKSPLSAAYSVTTINVPLEHLAYYASSNITGIDGVSVSSIKSSYTLPTSSIGSFSIATAVTLPEGLRAYYCKNYNSTAGTIATKEITGAIPANTGVLLRGDAGEAYTITASSETPEAISDNALVAVTEATHVDQTDGDYTNFMMKGGKFIKIAASSNPDDKLPANRAYLPILTSALSTIGSNSIEVKWDEETSISNVNGNGNVNHKDAWYSLDGRKLNGIPAKGGVYINNGKKVVK